ncbi:MAG: hypothetical protein BWY68_00650 [bacterium ADurb.Bin400]|nr:MAG: hypothetical protein BWY68_00650 [bacterium ADurb.Bin400]
MPGTQNMAAVKPRRSAKISAETPREIGALIREAAKHPEMTFDDFERLFAKIKRQSTTPENQ